MLDAIAERWWCARPRSRFLVIFVAALTATSVVATMARPAEDDVRVLLAERELSPGDTVTATDVRTAWWPEHFIPDGAVNDPTGVVTAPLPRGAVITDRHVGEAGVGARIPPGRRAVAVPVEHLPPLGTGARLDLVAAGHDGAGVPLTNDAIVIAADEDVVWIAVEPSAATAVSAAAVAGRIAAVVHPSPAAGSQRRLP